MSRDCCVALLRNAVAWVCLQFVIVVFPDHTHLLCLPNCSLGPPECETKLSSKNVMGYIKIHGFHGNP